MSPPPDRDVNARAIGCMTLYETRNALALQVPRALPMHWRRFPIGVPPRRGTAPRPRRSAGIGSLWSPHLVKDARSNTRPARPSEEKILQIVFAEKVTETADFPHRPPQASENGIGIPVALRRRSRQVNRVAREPNPGLAFQKLQA